MRPSTEPRGRRYVGVDCAGQFVEKAFNFLHQRRNFFNRAVRHRSFLDPGKHFGGNE